ncbi:ROK family protein [Chryseobacterium tructae]|uniref:ROK family protein n=1 Tax=Chryseobacterium tructae TaxID=1037380 RepID=UPI0025B2B415|nr:ROK family protein [Chryseobacterium tructae]MDN3695314.1 ROK family protein [Chryseobacterium tructae]
MQNIIGIDIGGSHITLAQVDPEKREIITSTYVREHVNSFDDKEIIFSAWASAIEKATHDLIKADLLIGVAMPGPFDYEQGISLMQQGKFIDIYQINIKDELAARLSISPKQIHFVNDAAAFMEGEVFGGCVQGYKRIFGVTLGTGLGTTFIMEILLPMKTYGIPLLKIRSAKIIWQHDGL